MTGEVTAAIADFAVANGFDEIPSPVIDRAKIHILDTLGLVLAGSGSAAAKIAQAHILDIGGAGGCSVFGTCHRAPARFAAFANATAAHADNFDDTAPQIDPSRTGGIHVSGAMLPVALALAESKSARGKDILAAYLVGVEVSSRLNHAVDARHYADGFHTTGTLNVFGAACVAARMYRLDRGQIVSAIGVAASRAGGVRRNFGSMAEILHTAHAAEDGLVAAEMVSRGLTSADDALDGPTGFLAAAAGAADADRIVDRLANPWVFENPGVWIKPHPNGALTHPGAGCLLALLQDNDIRPADIERIGVRTNERVWKTLQHHDPQDSMQAKFSMEFTLAVIAVHRRAGLSEFTNEMLRRPDTVKMMRRVYYTAYETADAGFTNVTTFVDVRLSDGRTVSGRADFARGSTADPMDFDDVAGKFRECAEFSGADHSRIDRIVGLVSEFEMLEDVKPLVTALSG